MNDECQLKMRHFFHKFLRANIYGVNEIQVLDKQRLICLKKLKVTFDKKN